MGKQAATGQKDQSKSSKTGQKIKVNPPKQVKGYPSAPRMPKEEEKVKDARLISKAPQKDVKESKRTLKGRSRDVSTTKLDQKGWWQHPARAGGALGPRPQGLPPRAADAATNPFGSILLWKRPLKVLFTSFLTPLRHFEVLLRS